MILYGICAIKNYILFSSCTVDNHVFRRQRLVFGTVLRQGRHNSVAAQQETAKSVRLPPGQSSPDVREPRTRPRCVIMIFLRYNIVALCMQIVGIQ